MQFYSWNLHQLCSDHKVDYRGPWIRICWTWRGCTFMFYRSYVAANPLTYWLKRIKSAGLQLYSVSQKNRTGTHWSRLWIILFLAPPCGRVSKCQQIQNKNTPFNPLPIMTVLISLNQKSDKYWSETTPKSQSILATIQPSSLTNYKSRILDRFLYKISLEKNTYIHFSRLQIRSKFEKGVFLGGGDFGGNFLMKN